MHRATYSERIEIQQINKDWLIVRTITATWKNKSLDVYKEIDNGECFCRNLNTSPYCGRVVAFPGENYTSSYSWGCCYYGSGIITEEKWHECNRIEFITERSRLLDIEEHRIVSLYPDFQYVLKKWENATTYKIMKVFPFWKEHKEVEFLLALGFESIATNKNFYRLKPENKKKIIKWIQKHPQCKDYTLSQIQTIIKNKLNTEEYASYLDFCNHLYSLRCSYPVFAYLKKHNIANAENLRLYKDYIGLVKQTYHSLKESYWLYPTDLRKMHSDVLDEVNKAKTLQEQETKKKLEDQIQKQIKNVSKFNTEIKGYSIFVSSSLAEWEKQADVLHQCIIRCNYTEKVARGEELIVFIQKEGVPIATAEILHGKKLGQFYADEHSGTPNGSRPNEEVKEVFNEYLSTLPKKLFNKKVVENA